MAQRESTWIRLDVPVRLPKDLTPAQEAAIRDAAAVEGYPDLRGFHMYLRSQGWTYYDFLREHPT